MATVRLANTCWSCLSLEHHWACVLEPATLNVVLQFRWTALQLKIGKAALQGLLEDLQLAGVNHLLWRPSPRLTAFAVVHLLQCPRAHQTAGALSFANAVATDGVLWPKCGSVKAVAQHCAAPQPLVPDHTCNLGEHSGFELAHLCVGGLLSTS